jgi:hypothetical protein
MFSSISDASVGNEANGQATPRTLRAVAANRLLLLEPALGSASIRGGGDLPASGRVAWKRRKPCAMGTPGRQDCYCRVPGAPARRAQSVAQPAHPARCNNYRAGIDRLPPWYQAIRRCVRRR